jgi:hypothetical protein
VELGLSREAIMQLNAGKEEADEKAERVAKDLRHECLTLYFYLCSVQCILIIRLIFCRIGTKCTHSSRSLETK